MTLLYNLDSFVANLELPFHFLTSIELMTLDPYRIFFRGRTTLFNRHNELRYGLNIESASSAGVEIQSIIAHVEFCTPHIIRMRMYTGMGDVIPPNLTPMVVETFEDRNFHVEHIHTPTANILRTSALSVHVTPDLSDTRILSSDGRTLWKIQPPPRPPEDRAAATDYWLRRYRDTFPIGYVTDGRSTQTFFSINLQRDEQIYGLGEKFGALNKRGQSLLLWNDNAMGNTRKASYKNIPFFMSSAGYGIFLNMAAPTNVHFGDMSFVNYSVHVQDRLMDVYFIEGRTFKDILARYTQLTGKPSLPPMWSFGLWASYDTYRHQNEVETLADRIRSEQIPCDVLHLDSETDPSGADVNFPPDRFPDPSAMIAKLHERGFHTSTTLPPYIVESNPLYQEGIDNEYFAQHSDGTPLILKGEFGSAALVDFSKAAAATWIQQKIDSLLDVGIDALATYSGDSVPLDGYYGGGNGLTMRNLYTLFFQRTVFDQILARKGTGVIWGRSAFAGSQRYPVHWNGFTLARWEDLAASLRGGLSLGMSGLPFWGNDIGGFDGTPSPELYIRWAQAALFVSHVRLYGKTSRNAWDYGDEALKIFRKYAQLRYQLMPYIWSTANRCVETSQPFIRPLVLDWQDDPTTAYIDDQWMFGESILVAPILDETNRRKVYLPAGDWLDYWTHERLTGGRWLSVEAPLDVLPLYIRAGAIIPMSDAHEIESTTTMKWTPLTLDIFAAADGSFTLYEGDQRFEYTVKRQPNSVEITLDAERITTIYLLGVPTTSRFTADGSPIVVNETQLGESTMTAILDVQGRIIRAEWD